jgi:hypothetical protein
MKLIADYHPEFWMLIPGISLHQALCDNPACPGCDGGMVVSLDWLAWSVAVVF